MFVRVVCAASLQNIFDLRSRQWAFSFALDVGIKQGTSYLDFRARFEQDGKLHKLHLVAVPIVRRKTSAIIFAARSKLLGSLAPKWRNQLIGMSTDG